MKSVYDILSERGFIEQVTDEAEARRILAETRVTCYIGFDPTATSLHIGSLVPIMSLAHMQRSGHRPIALVGGGTAMIGDPSGKTEMRQVLSREKVNANAEAIKGQLSKYLDFGEGRALLVNNADWLLPLRYIEFLRDIGRHFSVNRMLAAESYRMRLETGLNFIEFNYMLLQAYDFLYLFQKENCLLQMGGNDQWGNIVAGIDLVRRVEGKQAYGITFPLITTSTGSKMGKTEKGTVWLDSAFTSPHEYYQYWINSTDADVERFMALFTFLPIEEIREVRNLSDAGLNQAKAVLAFEATKVTHGEQAAVAAWRASSAAFGAKPVEASLFPSSSIPREKAQADVSAIPSVEKRREDFGQEGIPAFELFHEAGLCKSRGEARRNLEQGGGYVNGEPIKTFDEKIGLWHITQNGEILLRKGKKTFFRIVVR
ncbi:MAG: tyrosine--tRNA ligase [Pseudomonadota bacterium]|jgi:tyrosyl-tRNA synthetase|nr:tyrosine--tRNA ligase [Syntrophaceae bacterium]MDI9556112.1 tyrosine--tRNA ligase [Pseudomonadota bacterium]NLX32073.1 tyrosine--tRNA ligase [Deltaproteobacteria bacterium]HNU84987.1 tyrosine--tRNA ligase [Syntrophales bacterium]HNZ35778.1 tyrosine--tRNA ligase [Syntrophales bacterium]